MPDFFDGFCSLIIWSEADLGGYDEGYGIHPPAIFLNVFDVCNFFIISNLFDSNMPYAISTHNRICAKKCITVGEALRIRVKQFKQNLPQIIEKALK